MTAAAAGVVVVVVEVFLPRVAGRRAGIHVVHARQTTRQVSDDARQVSIVERKVTGLVVVAHAAPTLLGVHPSRSVHVSRERVAFDG